MQYYIYIYKMINTKTNDFINFVIILSKKKHWRFAT